LSRERLLAPDAIDLLRQVGHRLAARDRPSRTLLLRGRGTAWLSGFGIVLLSSGPRWIG
jgi:hypothetical protein